jgi:hypothetical protein
MRCGEPGRQAEAERQLYREIRRAAEGTKLEARFAFIQEHAEFADEKALDV